MRKIINKIKSIHENQYIISDNSAKHLLDLGFEYYKLGEEYTYYFPVLKFDGSKYGGKVNTFYGRITASADTNEIQIDVMDNNYILYAPFYNIEYGNYDFILNKINKAILNEFSKLKITRKRDKENEN